LLFAWHLAPHFRIRSFNVPAVFSLPFALLRNRLPNTIQPLTVFYAVWEGNLGD